MSAEPCQIVAVADRYLERKNLGHFVRVKLANRFFHADVMALPRLDDAQEFLGFLELAFPTIRA